ASGLIRTSVRSTATGAGYLLVAGEALGGVLVPADPFARPPRRAERPLLGGHRHRLLEHGRATDYRRLAVRAHLPERLEGVLAGHARLLQLRRAHRADEELG